MKKFTYIIASALALTCAVTAIPTVPENITETHAVYIAPDPHSIPASGLQADYFYNEIGEISYCKCGEIVTCIPIANPGSLHVTYKLNGEEFTPDNVTRNFTNDSYDTTADTDSTGHTGYESISFFPKEVNKEYTLEIKVEFSSAVTDTDEDIVADPISVEENYKFNFRVDSNGVIIPEDACITPSTYQQTEIFKRKYGNYTAFENKVIVCTPWYWNGGYDVVVNSTAENSATLLSEATSTTPTYYVDNATGVVYNTGGGSGNKVLTFDASKEGTYSVNVYNQRGGEEMIVDPIQFTYHVDQNGNITFQQVSKLSVPKSYDEAKQFIEQYGESETDGFQVVEVIPVVKSDKFSIQPYSETDEVKPYVNNTATYYYNENDGCKGYQVTVYTMNRSLSSDEIHTEKLYHVTNTEYKVDEDYTIRKAYFCGYLIDKETKSFKEYLTEPASFAESQVFLRKYGNFCADPNQKKVIAVIPEHYELNHEIGGTAELLKTKYYDDDMAQFIDDDGQLIEACDLGGNKILMFDASKAGDYTIRINETWAGNPDNVTYYSIDYSVDDSGNITLSEPSENPQIPETIESFSDADKVFNSNGGYVIKQGETLQIAVPVNFGVEKPGGGMGYEEYETTLKGNFNFPNGLETIDEQLYINDNSVLETTPLGYRVYTYDLSPKEYEVITTEGDFVWVTGKIVEGDFSITYTTSDRFNPYGKENKYTFRFNCTDDITTNTGVVSNDSGDANGDGNIDIADVVTLSAFIGNADINTVSDKAKIYCDVQSHGNGIDASDVLMIQQYIANVITEF